MMAATGDSLLTTFQKHIEDMRGLTLCKICLRPFYEPFTLACGHTYCYSCLRDWLHGPRDQTAEKGCPDCRQKIETEPSPNYTLRDLVHMFVNRVELLPEDESVEEHERGKCAEAKVLADDRKGSGVFRGMFKRTRRSLLGFDRALRDAADGVDRCPKCMWEMEEGECNSCGWPRIDYSDDDFDSADDLAELHSIDRFHPTYHGVAAGLLGHLSYPYSDVGTDQSPDDYSGDEDEHDSELDDFIDDEADEDDDYPTEIDHDDGLSDHTDTYDAYQSTGHDHTDTGLSTDNGSDDDVQGPYQHARVFSGRDRRALVTETDTSQEDDGSESETATQGTDYDNDTDTTPRRTRIRPLTISWSQAQPARHEEEEDDYDEDDDDNNSFVQERSAARATKRARTRRVIESDEDEDEDENEGGDDGNMSADESQASGSTTTAQSAAHRLGRLQARRAHNSFSRYVAQRADNYSPQPTRRMVPQSANWARRGGGSTGDFRRRPENRAGAGAARNHPYTRVR